MANWWKEDWSKMAIVVEDGLDIEGEELLQDLVLPAKPVVCHRCNGKGVHDCFEGGITGEEWDRDWDYDMRDDYMAGHYDTPCTVCKGRNVVLEVDEEHCNPEHLKEWHSMLESASQSFLESEAERRAGC